MNRTPKFNRLTKLVTTSFVLISSCVTSPLSFAQNSASDQTPRYAIAIHGGAGVIEQENFTEQQLIAYKGTLKSAIDSGYAILEAGGASSEAVIAAIQVLEASPLFNAGRGAVYNFDGVHELDASIMDGRTLQAGAVSGVRNVKSPIALANAVKNNSVHVMLSGEGAEQFAAEQGLEQVDNSYFNTERRYQQLQQVKQKLAADGHRQQDYMAAHHSLSPEHKTGTVGAVAIDQQGNLAAGTSTGGMTAKRFGRIGDTPIIGAGTYANNASCAVSATGHGEYFIRYHVAADICARVQYQGISLAEAAHTVINDVLVEAGGSGGIIAIDKQANIVMPFNSKGMYRASRRQGEQTQVAIFKEPIR
ncbi:isoaspartyl peptidase/L-asparaginase [Thalassotalea ponticola]|uniref:isoaspartyl peptidase/L-asparaginase family protein n=1 Tax=Thalassotalea ponticola TaxID=1523392 RepID=UPI0025B30F28|nr:isoaspartyl peptidase/L-asparaginase [Thalassotalea ponticola]MDN3653109.1 isoaspartyl peptidase/L-asparaginase [Thalassotalea ponticola]